MDDAMLNIKSYKLYSFKTYPLFPSYRLVILMLLFWGAFVINANFYSLNFGITCMVNASVLDKNDGGGGSSAWNSSVVTQKPEPETCVRRGVNISEATTTESFGGTYLWDRKIQATLLAGEAIGAIWFIFLAGYLLDKFGAKWLFLIAVFLLGGSTVLIPIASAYSWVYVLILRCIGGIGMEVSFPAVFYVTVRWFPARELSTVTAFAVSGFPLAGIFTMLASGAFCESFLGWHAIFYTCAIITVVIAVAWTIFFSDKVAEARFIQPAEVAYIKRNRAQNETTSRDKINVPLRAMFSSVPVWALAIVNLCSFYAFYFVGDFAPTYMKEVLKMPPQMTGAMTALPYAATFVGRLSSGIASDFLNRYVSNSNGIRIFTIISGFLPGLFFLLITMFDCNSQPAAITCLVMSYLFFGFNVGGSMRSTCLLAPQFTGSISGMSTTAMYLAGILSPYITGAIIPDGTAAQWRTAWYVTGAVHIFGTIIFLILGSGEIQPWAIQDAERDGRNSVISMALSPYEARKRRVSVVAMVGYKMIHERIDLDEINIYDPRHSHKLSESSSRKSSGNSSAGGRLSARSSKRSSLRSIRNQETIQQEPELTTIQE